jgi:hypothetical protein
MTKPIRLTAANNARPCTWPLPKASRKPASTSASTPPRVNSSSTSTSTRDLDEAQAHLGGGVVGGLAMIGQFDAAEEIRRHLVAVGADVAQVALVQPQSQAGG